MIKLINLEFFKGGSTTEKVEKRDPKSPQQLAMDAGIYSLISPIAARYGGTSVLPNITTTKITQPEPNYSNSYYGVNQSGYNRHGDYTGNGQYDASGRRVNYGRTPSPQQTTTIQSQTPNLAGFNASQLGKNFDIADAQKSLADANTLNLLANNGQNLNLSQNALRDMESLANNYVNPYGKTDFDGYVNKMGQNVDNSTKYATKYYDDADWYLNQNKDLASKGTNQGLTNLMSEVYKSINSNFGKDASALIADAASRGVVNSTTGNRAMQGLSDAASSAAGEQYMSGFQSLLNNALQGAQTADNLAQNVVSTANTSTNNYKDVINSMLGVNENALGTMQGRANVLNNASQGYNRDYTTGLQGLETMAKLPSQYYQNALAPISPFYNYWKDLTDAYYGHEDYDYIVSQNGK